MSVRSFTTAATVEIARQDSAAPASYHEIATLPTNKFINSTVRASMHSVSVHAWYVSVSIGRPDHSPSRSMTGPWVMPA